MVPQWSMDVIAYLAVYKASSTTMSSLLRERALWHGWDHFKRQNDVTVCTALSFVGYHQSGAGMEAGRRPACDNVPAGYVVRASYGFCELLHAFTGRSCRYFTLLREPLARLISDWNYYCLDCAENGRRCVQDNMLLRESVEFNRQLPRARDGISLVQPRNSCPQQGILDFAVRRGNPYVAWFGHDISNISTDSTALERAVTFERAWHALHRSDMLVLFTEDLADGALDHLWQYMNETMPVPNVSQHNEHRHRRTPTVNESIALKRILAHDLTLYWSLRNRTLRTTNGVTRCR